ncbi:MAG TPA: hypothetical protein VJ144_01690 [Candidatus Polarisedimenticolia bacterium]|nr:hypothetical protein [Candidatus Polarisedimenticolia bacterium]
MTPYRRSPLRMRERGTSRTAFLALVIVGAIGAVLADETKKPQGPPPRSRPATVFKATKPTPARALPDLKSRVLFLVRPGEQVTVVTGGVRVPDAPSWTASKTCCARSTYDPDQQTDIVDHVGEGYAPVFHAGHYPGSSSPATRFGCGDGTDTGGCGQPVTLREPNGLGLWVQVVGRGGRQRAWILVP